MKTILCSLACVFIGGIIMYCYNYTKPEQISLAKDTIYIETTKSDWELIKTAIIWQESKDIHPNIYQLTSIYVKEVNNICGEKAFTIDDTYNKEKSDEMFEIFNGKHNPHKNVDRAIQLHNPGGGNKYFGEVKNLFNLLKYNQQ